MTDLPPMPYRKGDVVYLPGHAFVAQEDPSFSDDMSDHRGRCWRYGCNPDVRLATREDIVRQVEREQDAARRAAERFGEAVELLAYFEGNAAVPHHPAPERRAR